MEDSDVVRDLMAKLMEAVEASLSSSGAVREALAELVQNGYEAKLFFVANAESADGADDEDEDGDASAELRNDADEEENALAVREIGATAEDGELEFGLTKLDQDFLRSVKIRPESR